MDLSTRYLGLTLVHPFIAGASPLGDDLDSIRRLEDGGAAAIVLRSIFEEQITMARSGLIHHMDAFEPQFQSTLESFPKPDDYVLSPERYLELLRAAKTAADIPIIASLNGLTPESWLTMATSFEEAGAAALELNPYEVVTDADMPAAAIEDRIVHLVRELRKVLSIPVAVKLSPVLHGVWTRGTRSDARGCRWARALQSVLSNRLRYRENRAGSPDLAVIEQRVACQIALGGDSAEPHCGIACRERRSRHTD